MTRLAESDVEQAAHDWLEGLDWQRAHGSDVAPDAPGAERADSGRIALKLRQVHMPAR
ncbi:MAG: hypothetical protein OXG33_08645 [Chloroflexi bacterium]|nr:hypothetical protein [Chloroflexota bacterium]